MMPGHCRSLEMEVRLSPNMVARVFVGLLHLVLVPVSAVQLRKLSQACEIL